MPSASASEFSAGSHTSLYLTLFSFSHSVATPLYVNVFRDLLSTFNFVHARLRNVFYLALNPEINRVLRVS